jgi:peptidoglycan/LPS O-acetylase OafA/YrhL
VAASHRRLIYPAKRSIIEAEPHSQARAASSIFYHPELDVLRFAAFLFVFVHHAFPHEADAYTSIGWSPLAAIWLASGVWAFGVGVDLFFLLSSYLITELLIREIAVRGP